MYRMKGLAFALALLAAAPAQADWTGKGELGGVLARGNTETETINGKLDMTTESERLEAPGRILDPAYGQ